MNLPFGGGDADNDFSDYDHSKNALVVGRARRDASGEIASVDAREFGPKHEVENFVQPLDPRPDEIHLIEQANATVDAKIHSGELDSQLSDFRTRTTFVYFELKRLIEEHRAARAVAEARREPDSPTREALARVFGELSSTRAVEKKARPAAASRRARSLLKRRKREVAKAEEPSVDALASLGIPGLGVRPNTPAYVEIMRQGDSPPIRFRYHWGIKVGEEMISLVYDARYKPFRPETLRRLLALQDANREMRVGDTREAVESATALRVLTPCQVFEFGCFQFVNFFLAD